ncbi:MAG: hypothetical protein ACK5WZ_06890 [Pseudobdellovibrionaceae bacterium]
MNQEIQNLLTLRLDELKKRFPHYTSADTNSNPKMIAVKILAELIKEQIPGDGTSNEKTL